MGRNLIGYFRGEPDCDLYTVKIITDSANTEFTEIDMAGDSPFVVTYDTSKTPFDPIRFSRASMNVVASEYFFDVFSSDAQGTRVELYKEENGTDKLQWYGFLTTNLLNMPQDSCINTFSLEAQDALSTLKNFDYHTIGEKKQIVSFLDIIKQIGERMRVKNIYVDDTRPERVVNSGYTILGMVISEQNFYSSDTDEPWNLREVLEEISKYFGYTALQYEDGLYFFSIQSHTVEGTWQTSEDIRLYSSYKWDISWNSYQNKWNDPLNINFRYSGATIRESIIKGTGSDITLEPIYNKIQVKDSFYEIKEFIPDIFADELLTNRAGDFWQCNQIGGSGTLRYIGKGGTSKKEEKDESEHIYYQRKFDHKDYESVYRNVSTMESAATGMGIKVTDVNPTQNTYIESGWGDYVITATFTNTDSVRHIIDVHAFLKYEWWDGEAGYIGEAQSDSAAGWTSQVLQPGQVWVMNMSLSATFDTNFMENCTFDVYYTIEGVSKHFPLSQGTDDTKGYIGGTIVDLAVFDKPMSTQKYNYETESNISFDRYLMIHQCDKPANTLHPYSYWIFSDDIRALNDNEIEQWWPCVFRLKGGYVNPIMYDDNAYLSIDASAIFERYDREYINPDWSKENTDDNGFLGLFNKTHGVTTHVPGLIFKLKIGNYYWSSQSGWTTTDSCFVVDLGTDKTKKDNVDFTAWWNCEHPVLNNVSWTDWAGVSGYKIPLTTDVNMNDPITFQVHLPSKLQMINSKGKYDGINNYCWIKNLKVSFATKNSLNYQLSDVLYENVINSGSVNTLSDVTCKITTYPGQGMHSYSNVGIHPTWASGKDVYQLLETGTARRGLGGANRKAEEHIIAAYANQYSSPTIKQTLVTDIRYNPFTRFKDPIYNKYFAILGQTLDYARGTQNVSLIQTKAFDYNL